MTSNAPRPEGYEEFFGFTAPPFSLSADPRFRFPSAAHENALSQLMYALQRREPVIVVTGDIGLGKTLLCRTVLERLPRKTFLSVINDPLLGPDDLLKRILEDFGVISAEHSGSVTASRHELTHAMHTFLASLSALDAHAVVIVDEAQHMRLDVLEQIRLLANTGDEGGTLLQIVLVGQPSVQAMLANPELQQVRQRVTRCITLSALTGDEVKQYIAHRLSVARETETDSSIPGAYDLAREVAAWNASHRPVTFTDEAIQAAARISHGVPRVVNVLCDRALELAFDERLQTVDGPTIEAAARLVHLSDATPATTEFAMPTPMPAATAATAAPAATDGQNVSRTRRYGATAAAAILVAGALVYFGGRMLRGDGETKSRPVETRTVAPAPTPTLAPRTPTAAPPETPAPSPTPAPVPTQPATAPPAAVATPNPSAADASAGARDSFEILVASFRTEAKATEVVDQLKALGHSVRMRSLGGWQQVVAGPFASKAAADDAQHQLDREGFADTHIVAPNR